jgi:hypothetical protein
VSPEDERSGPVATRPAEESLDTTDSSVDVPAIFPRSQRRPSDFVRMIRPRAEYRRGRRGKTVIEVAHGERSAWFYSGATYVLLEAVAAVHSPWQWTLKRDAIMVPIQNASEVEAWLTSEGHAIATRMLS